MESAQGGADNASISAEVRNDTGEAWLRRKLDDQEQLLRKTQHQVRELSEALAAMAGAEARRQHWANLNSFVAYLLFCLLLIFGAYVLFQNRIGTVSAARDNLRKERDLAAARAKDLQSQLAARDAAGATALAYYQLVREGKRADIVSRYRSLPQDALSPTEKTLFNAAFREAQAAIADSGMSSAIAAFRAGNLTGAISDLTRLLQDDPDPARIAQMRYYLGAARLRAGQAAEAVAELRMAIDAGAERAGLTDAPYQLALALEGAGQLADARVAFEAFVAAQPNHPQSWPARRKIRALAAGQIISGVTGPATAGQAGPPVSAPAAGPQTAGTTSGAKPTPAKPGAAPRSSWLPLPANGR